MFKNDPILRAVQILSAKRLAVLVIVGISIFAGAILQNRTAKAANFTSVQSGNWNNPATWGAAGFPACGDDVTIANGHTVTLTSNTGGLSCNLNITINNGGTLDLGGFELNYSGNNTTFTNNGTFANSGAFNRLISNNGGANFTFAGNGIYSGNLKLENFNAAWHIAANTSFTFNSAANNVNLQIDHPAILDLPNDLNIIGPSSGTNYVIFDNATAATTLGTGTIKTQGNIRIKAPNHIDRPVETVSGAAQGEGVFRNGWTVDSGASLMLSGAHRVSNLGGGSGLVISNGAIMDLAGNQLEIAFNAPFTNNGTVSNSGSFNRIVFLDNGAHSISGTGAYSGNVGLEILDNVTTIAPGSTLTFGAPAGNTNIQTDPAATLAFNGSGSLTLSGSVSNGGAIRFNEGGAECGNANNIVIRSSVAGTQRAWTGGGTYSMKNLDVKDQAGTSAIVVAGGVNSGNNGANWTFPSLCPCLPAGNGKVLWHKAEANTTDSSGNANTGSLINGATFADGKVGQAYSFNGSSHVRVPDSPTLDVTTQFTMDAWINPAVLHNGISQGGIISKIGGGGGNNGYQFGLTTNNTQLWCQFNATGEPWPQNQLIATVPGGVPIDQWTHVACTYDNADIKIFVNGTLIGTQNIGPKTVANTSSTLRISSDDNNNVFFNGKIDEAEVYNRALTAGEIGSIYNVGSTGQCGGTCPTGSTTYSDSFTTGLDPTFWNVVQTTPGLFSIDTANGDVRLAKTAMNSPGGIQNISVRLNLSAFGGPVSGDFSAQIDFRDAVLGPSIDQVEFQTQYADNSVFFDVYDNGGGTNVHVWNGTLQGVTPVAGNSGTFRISRTGATVTGSYNGTPMFSQSNSSPLTRLDFVLQLQPGSNDMTSVTFDNFSFAGGQCGGCAITSPANKVSWWQAEGNPNDSVGTNNGSLVGGTTYTAGKVGQAFNLNGTNAGVTIPHNTNLDVNAGGFTTEFWMKSNSAPTGQVLVIDKSHGFVDSAGWAFQSNPAGNRLSWFIGAGGGGSTNFVGVESTVNPFDGNFHHIAGTWDGSNIRMYVDGVLQGTTPFTAPVNNTRPVNIGFAWGGGSPQRWFNGVVDEVAIYARALNEAEIRGAAGRCAPVRADFDGDGKTDLSVFRPSEGNWYTNGSTAGFGAIHWGANGDVPIPGDYDGDGKTDYAVWRPSDTLNVTDFYILNSNGFTIAGYSHGLTTDIPVPGDFDGDGKADIVVWRPSTGDWWLWTTISQTTTSAQFGSNGDVPMAMDKDGDGKANLTVYRPLDRTFYMANSTGVPAQNFTSAQWGLAGDLLVPADYDGDNKDDVAVFRPSNGVWYILRSTGGTSFVQFGASGDVPVPGDYDGDDKDDQAVYRGGTWYLNRSTSGFSAQAFGLGSDVAVPAKYIP